MNILCYYGLCRKEKVITNWLEKKFRQSFQKNSRPENGWLKEKKKRLTIAYIKGKKCSVGLYVSLEDTLDRSQVTLSPGCELLGRSPEG